MGTVRVKMLNASHMAEAAAEAKTEIVAEAKPKLVLTYLRYYSKTCLLTLLTSPTYFTYLLYHLLLPRAVQGTYLHRFVAGFFSTVLFLTGLFFSANMFLINSALAIA